jgi:2-iminobutanoate/2-iminopropanoate deaminase
VPASPALERNIHRATEGCPLSKDVVRTEAAPAPFQGAPYSQAIEAGGFVFVSGQLALRPGEQELVPGDIGEQTEQVFANLRAILEAAGSSLEQLVKTTVFLQRLDDFAGMNEVYAKHVGGTPPARSTVEVAKLPSGALVEIEAIALL